MTETHTTPRYRINIKRFTHVILKHQSQSGMKLQMKVILAACIDLLSEFKLVSSRGGFLLSRREAIFVEERDLSPLEGWNSVFVEDKETVEKLQAISDKSGIPKHQIIDHLVRLVRDLKMLSADQKGKVRLRAAIEGRNETVQIDQLQGLSPEAIKRLREHGLMIEYPLFAQRLKIDSHLVELVEKCTNMDLVKRLAAGADEMSPMITHSFTCRETGETVTDGWNVGCPDAHDGSTLLEECIRNCDHLSIERNWEFKMPDGFCLDYDLATRLGFGRSEDAVTNEARAKGREEYAKNIRTAGLG